MFFWLTGTAAAEVKYEPPFTQKVVLDDSVGMTTRERDDYATNLAVYLNNVMSEVKGKKGKNGDQALYDQARRVLALALHLSPRNKKAMVLNFQLKKGVAPEVVESKYSAPVLARLLMTRAEVLIQQKGEKNKYLARCFVELAATFDPRNVDAVYAYEIQQLENGELDWKVLTEARKGK